MTRKDIVADNIRKAIQLWQYLSELDQNFVVSCTNIDARRKLTSDEFNRLHCIVNQTNRKVKPVTHKSAREREYITYPEPRKPKKSKAPLVEMSAEELNNLFKELGIYD